jgi:hypothetical protein
MNIVFVETKDIKQSFGSLLDLHLTGLKYFDAGNSPNEAETRFKELDRWLEDHSGRTAIITTSTFSAGRDEPGSAYDVVSDWLTQTALSQERLNSLFIIAHPSFENRAKSGFIPFDNLVEACEDRGVTVYSCPKTESPNALIEIIQRIFDGPDIGKEHRQKSKEREV